MFYYMYLRGHISTTAARMSHFIMGRNQMVSYGQFGFIYCVQYPTFIGAGKYIVSQTFIKSDFASNSN